MEQLHSPVLDKNPSMPDDDGNRVRALRELREQTLPSRPYIPICSYGTRERCPVKADCQQVHFERSLRSHTQVSLGDCSYLNTCHRMDTCRYVHWILEDPGPQPAGTAERLKQRTRKADKDILPPQWINADLRSLDVSVLGKFDVVVADPPWAIHQELPYGTLTDDEMLRMPVGSMQDEGGLLFLWVTGRAMELGRDCLKAWGYERIDELIWVKMNQLQGLIRTGRTGHWLNHSKEHCIVAVRKSSIDPTAEPRIPGWFSRGLDTQVILAEVRETSRKPDELYDMVERLLGGTGRGRKVELFGRSHNLRDGWFTIGNQFKGLSQIFEGDVVQRYNARYPEQKIELLDTETKQPVV